MTLSDFTYSLATHLFCRLYVFKCPIEGKLKGFVGVARHLKTTNYELRSWQVQYLDHAFPSIVYKSIVLQSICRNRRIDK
jgi:hypothetical protein